MARLTVISFVLVALCLAQAAAANATVNLIKSVTPVAPGARAVASPPLAPAWGVPPPPPPPPAAVTQGQESWAVTIADSCPTVKQTTWQT